MCACVCVCVCACVCIYISVQPVVGAKSGGALELRCDIYVFKIHVYIDR